MDQTNTTEMTDKIGLNIVYKINGKFCNLRIDYLPTGTLNQLFHDVSQHFGMETVQNHNATLSK